MTEISKLYCSWKDVDNLVMLLYKEMKKDKYKPDFIAGISRGGLPPAVMLSHLFDVPMVPVIWATRDFVKQDEERVTEIQRHVMDECKSLLVVDDICDTGYTFRSFQEFLMPSQAVGFAPGVEFCSLHLRHSSDFTPTYFGVEIPDDSWIVYPYEE